MMAATAMPIPIPAFAPVESPEEALDELDVDVDDAEVPAPELNMTVAEDSTTASTLSVDCHLSSTGYAWIIGCVYVMAVVVVGVTPRTV
jgi:hypothetical protein